MIALKDEQKPNAPPPSMIVREVGRVINIKPEHCLNADGPINFTELEIFITVIDSHSSNASSPMDMKVGGIFTDRATKEGGRKLISERTER